MITAEAVLSLAGSLAGKGRLSILVYHQVLATPDPMRPSEPTQAVFDWHMQLLARYFSPLPLDEAIERLNTGDLPTNAVCVTFDDGYKNNLTLAQPILAKYGIPATVFVATGYSEGKNMWNDRVIHLFADPCRERLSLDGELFPLGGWVHRRELAQSFLQKLKYLPAHDREAAVNAMYKETGYEEQQPLMMDWADIRALRQSRVSVGAHTVNHPILKDLPESRQRWEISQSRKALEEVLQEPVTQFAYPNGKYGTDYDDLSVDLVRAEGFSCAVSTDWGVSTKGTNRWQLCRFTPWDKSSLRFHGRLLINQLGFMSRR
jgi:peptidoglycan/xylan/chitin deacetylase (PgdA/CDA1 family)